MRSAGRRRMIGFGTLVLLLVTAALSLGAVLYQLFEGGHAGGASGPVTSAIDAAGFAMLFLLGTQLMTGYRLVRVGAARFRTVHVATAWSVAALLSLHAAGAVAHTIAAPQVLPVVLDLIGAVLLALVGLQLLSGYAQSRPRGSRSRAVHATVALAVGVAVAGHAVLAIVHTVAG